MIDSLFDNYPKLIPNEEGKKKLEEVIQKSVEILVHPADEILNEKLEESRKGESPTKTGKAKDGEMDKADLVKK